VTATAGAPGPAVLIYDGECPTCRASALWLMRRALAGGATALEILPGRSPLRAERFPGVPETACTLAMRLVLPDGRVLAGADAVPEILARIPRWRWLGGLLARPGLRGLAPAAYRWIARTRLGLWCRRPGSER
jgi:predicted DCC family thiol-disulfide oxidoreductase YuxK